MVKYFEHWFDKKVKGKMTRRKCLWGFSQSCSYNEIGHIQFSASHGVQIGLWIHRLDVKMVCVKITTRGAVCKHQGFCG
jgi:hypothetical protein